ncbi:MAG: acyltransferase [Candidatus Eremiobacteraeota bacterium]|nr:acyltransferase [Candidatus Eremiobacteraeota bacterium]MCW5867787.1 acyltransferase [Candidatus Eremiobacteraeota bacterium]
MGFLRTYLALCVVAYHSTQFFPWPVHDGRQAVQIFFCISGFYMALVLSERYHSAREFYISRWLRIFAPYYAVLLMVLAWSLLNGFLRGYWLFLTPYVNRPFEVNGATGVAFAAATNLTLFFQDWVMFFQHDAGTSFGFTSNFANDRAPLWYYLILPQCWSVGIEEMLYLTAPWLTSLPTRHLSMLLLGSVAARLCAYGLLGLQHDPFTYRFFPFEAALFILGILAYRGYIYFGLATRFPKCPPNFYLPILALLAVALSLHAMAVQRLAALIGEDYSVLLSYPFWAVGVALLFAYFREHKGDRWLGELCFPIYLLHFAVIQTVHQYLLGSASLLQDLGPCSAALTLLIAILFCQFFLQPFERWRHTYLARRKARIKKPLGASTEGP